MLRLGAWICLFLVFMVLGAEVLTWAESPAYRLMPWKELFQSLPNFIGTLPVWPILLGLSLLMYLLAPRRRNRRMFGRQ